MNKVAAGAGEGPGPPSWAARVKTGRELPSE